jgi:hypothetical protein
LLSPALSGILNVTVLAAAIDLTALDPGIWVWKNYDSAVKADLFSSALATAAGIYVVDPIPLAKAESSNLSKTAPIAGIVVTNANHSRASSRP